MGSRATELGPLAVSRLALPGLHFVGGVAGPDVSLVGAREAARQASAKDWNGIDPVADSRALRSAMKADQAQAKTFKRRTGLRSARTR